MTSQLFACTSDTYNLDSNYWAYTLALETKLGRKFAGFRLNGGFTGASADFAEMRKAYDVGRHWTYVNAKPSGTVTGYWKAVVAGKYDAAINGFINTVRTHSRWTSSNPFHYSFHHEQSVISEGGGSAAGTAADYAHAWNHVAGLIDKAGAHVSQGGNMARCWVPHWLQIAKDPAYGAGGSATANVSALLVSKILAGGLDLSKLDVVGADIYVTTTATFSAATQWNPLVKLANHVGKPFITGETGCAGSDTKVVKYLTDMDGILHNSGFGAGAGQCLAICWTSRVASGGDYRIDATPARLTKFKSLFSLSQYGATV